MKKCLIFSGKHRKLYDTKSHSNAHRGSDDEPTQAYTKVRRGARGGDNKDMRLNATWYVESMRRADL
ncbi:MAG: hypothetical protein C0392_15075 [Syntrophus sp. (in: bacteria)]|nr:hypothetical protein [Syntrophus sp. (in: bacteria)]